MTAPTVPDSEFISLFRKHGAEEVSRMLGVATRNIHIRRRRIERKHNTVITSPRSRGGYMQVEPVRHAARIHLEVKDGIVLIGSDAHYWPGIVSTAHRAFVAFAKEFKPKVVILNGDELDGSTISRFPPIGWESRPPLVEELEATKERTAEIDKAAPGAERIWTLGNHDGRFETRLATQCPEYARIHGFHLKDHFPRWRPAWAAWINDNVVVKHRFKGGMYAPKNNTLYAGKTMATGHLHSQKVMPFTDYNGTRWGVDLGCMADPDGPQFVDYTEDNPKDWRQGFGLFTFKDWKLLDPEVVRVWDEDHVCFRGALWKV